MKFIHAADLHIDSPLRGLEAYEGAPLDRIRNATRQAFENLIALAIQERVDFVIIAGDLFDGKWPDIKTGLWTAGQFRRLQRANIAAYLLRGNHDAASEVQQRIRWPENVREFSVDAPQTFVDERLAVALHGQGFPTRAIPEDLAAGYPDPVKGMFNIGVLHTSLTGDPQHDTYAPTKEETLFLKGYDYWALGHIHARQTIREEPFIGFSGNTQGRHINEPGAKGCLLVSLEAGRPPQVQFRETDTLRWERIEIELRKNDALDDLYSAVHRKLQACREGARGRFTAVRVEIRGACACHRDLVAKAGREEAVAEIRNLANSLEEVWVEKIVLYTSPPVDLEQLRRGNDLMGDLLRNIEALAADDAALDALAGEFAALTEKASLELEQAGIRMNDPAEMRKWLRQAEGMLVSMLGDDES